ncbi:MAG: hypothetical protein CTY31_01210 [Hyphomicrobium sp.]|nr:MAG: hypothetical protein CTY31_01210 [Hyphomicrobium sp.]
MTMIKSGLGLAGLVAVAALTAGSPAKAEEARELTYSANLGATSDYIFRGISLSGEDPVVFGGLDVGYGILYAGLWATDLGDNLPGGEVDFYVGVKPVLGPVTFDFGVIYYSYTENNSDLDYFELKAGASAEIAPKLTATGIFYYQIENDTIPEVLTYEATLAYALPQVFMFSPTLSGTVGYADDTDEFGAFTADGDSYTYWNAGISLAVEKLTFDLRYWDTDLDESEAIYSGESRFLFTAKVTLP